MQLKDMNTLRASRQGLGQLRQSIPQTLKREHARTNVGPALIAALATYTFFVSLIALAGVKLQPLPVILALHTAAIAAIYIFWRMTNWSGSRYYCYGAIALIYDGFTRFWGILDAIFYGTRIEFIPRPVPIPKQINLTLIQSEAISILGLLVLVSAWRLAIGENVDKTSLASVRSSERQKSTFVIAYVFSLISELIISAFPSLVSASGLSRAVGLVTMLGTVSIYFIGKHSSSKASGLFLAIALGLPLAASRISSGMKSEMFFPLLPAAFLGWAAVRSTPLRLLAVATAVTVLALASNFVDFVRQEKWWGTSTAGGAELARGFVQNLSKYPISDGYNKIFARLNMTCPRFMTTTITNSYGFEPEKIIFPIPTTFVPRILWPDKPSLNPGGQHTNRIWRLNIPDNKAMSSTASGFFNELYLGWGYTALLAGSAVYGVAFALLQRVIFRQDPHFATMCLAFYGGFDAARLTEHHVVYAYTSIVLLGVLITGAIFGYRVFRPPAR
jgi:hypothetical protein